MDSMKAKLVSTASSCWVIESGIISITPTVPCMVSSRVRPVNTRMTSSCSSADRVDQLGTSLASGTFSGTQKLLTTRCQTSRSVWSSMEFQSIALTLSISFVLTLPLFLCSSPPAAGGIRDRWDCGSAEPKVHLAGPKHSLRRVAWIPSTCGPMSGRHHMWRSGGAQYGGVTGPHAAARTTEQHRGEEQVAMRQDEHIDVVTVCRPVEGGEGEVHRVLAEPGAKSRTEPGCESYELYESTVLAGTYITIERWADLAAQESHTRGLAVKCAAAALRPHLEVLPVLHPLSPVQV